MSAGRNALFNQSLEKGLDVLHAFGAERRTMNLPEIAQAAGISKSAAQRLAYTLESLGYLQKDPHTRRFALGLRTLGFAYRYVTASALIERAYPYLLELNQKSQETVNLSEPDGLDMVFCARFASPIHSIVHMPVGKRLPIFCTSSGRAYLSALPEDEARAILEASDRVPYTQATEVDVEPLMARIRSARAEGYAWAEQEYYWGDLNIAVPLLNEAGRPIAAVNVSVDTGRWTMEILREKVAPMLIATAAMISSCQPDKRAVAPLRRGYEIAGTAPARLD